MSAEIAIPGLRCDGSFPVGDPVATQWTIIDPTSQAFGASFYVRPGESVEARAEETRKRFEEAVG
jgi:hypothetical protein